MTPTVSATPVSDSGVRTVRLTGALTFNVLNAMQEELRREVCPITIVDLTDVPYVDSAALGTFVAFHVSCERDGRKYALTGLNTRVLKLMSVCHMDSILRTFPTIEDAQRAFSV
jgi:anti-anti-sigma factor